MYYDCGYMDVQIINIISSRCIPLFQAIKIFRNVTIHIGKKLLYYINNARIRNCPFF